MARTKSLQYQYRGHQLPVEVHFERRTSSRVSLGKDTIVLRVPSLCRGPLLKHQLLWMGEWLEKTFETKPEQFIRLLNATRPYQNGDTLFLFDGPVSLKFVPAARKTLKGIFSTDRILTIFYPMDTSPNKKSITQIISRTLAHQYLPHFEEKVFHHNALHFEQPINDIRLKNNSSNWGSCSTNSTINLSTRLLLVPEIVQDYVVIHELAHLLEMNHSPRFWKIVKKAMPDYERHERWLKTNGTALML